jgi:Ca2+-binding RTX toxin-like protein
MATIVGTSASEIIDGTAGDDVLKGRAGNDTIRGLAGADYIDGGDGNDDLDGGDGNDTLKGRDGSDYIRGRDGADILNGGDGADILVGDGGNDFAYGGAGDDTISGGTGKDRLYGDDGNDVIAGGSNNDVLNGGAGDDILRGGRGNDALNGNLGADQLFGEDGVDRLYGHEGADQLDGGAGDDYLSGGADNDDLDGGAGADFLDGGDGADLLNGGDDNDIVKGRDGDDIVRGGAGDDIVNGGHGNDILIGDSGDDTLVDTSGGATFVFAAGWGNDTVVNYEVNDQYIDLTSLGLRSGSETLADAYAKVTRVQTGADVLITVLGHEGNSILLTSARVEDIRFIIEDGYDGVSPVFRSEDVADFAENATGTVYTASAFDPNDDTISFAINGGADASLFSINSATGALTFNAAPDYEAPADSGADNDYEVIIRATDGSNNTEQTVTVTVTDVNDNAPVITSAATASVTEGQTAAYDANATDADTGANLVYSISGTDFARFSLNASTGVVTFSSPPDFETPGDANGDNDYEFTITVSDGVFSTNQAVTVSVTDVLENADVPGDISTPVNLGLGETYDGEIEEIGDTDWVRVELVAGQRYGISLTGSGGSPLHDPLVRLYDASGDLVAENDDGGVGLNSLLSYTVQSTGTYYVEADAWMDATHDYVGTYTIGLETLAPLEAFSNDQIADFLRSGYWTGNGGTARRFNASEGDTITVNLTALTADGLSLARPALQLWSDLTGILFSEVTGSAQITFDDNEEGAFANTSYSGGFISTSTVNVGTDWVDTYGARIDGYAFQTYIHEIGHALGLGHGGPYNGSADYGVDASYLNDSWQATVMSYFSQTENTFIDASFAYVISPQVGDILAIADMYGLSSSTRGGDTTYGYNSTAGNVIYDASAFTRPLTYTIYDTGGTDLLDFSQYSLAQTLDLRPEYYSSVLGETGNIGIARGTFIENATTGAGNDTLIGNSADNVLTGNAGNDRFYSSGGADTMNGGNGTDTAVFSGASGDYSSSTNGAGNTVLTDNRVGSPDGTTELISIEVIEYGATAMAPLAAAIPKLAESSDPIADMMTPADLANFANGLLGLMDENDFELGGADFQLDTRSQTFAKIAANLFAAFKADKTGDLTTPVMDALDEGKLEDGSPVMKSLNEDQLGADDVVVMDGLDEHLKGNDVMPDLSDADMIYNQDLELPSLDLGVVFGADGMLSLEETDDPGLDVTTLVRDNGFRVLDPNATSNLVDNTIRLDSFDTPLPDVDGAGFAVLNDENGPGLMPPVMEPLSPKEIAAVASEPAIVPDSTDEPDLPSFPDTPEGW